MKEVSLGLSYKYWILVKLTSYSETKLIHRALLHHQVLPGSLAAVTYSREIVTKFITN